MTFKWIVRKDRHEVNRSEKEDSLRSSAFGKAMIASLILMAISCTFFVGTTLSWFTDQQAGSAALIKAGDFKAKLVIENSTSPAVTGSGTITPNVIEMVRIDKNSDYWEPGAVFASDVMYIQNTGTLDFGYKLELVTIKDAYAAQNNTLQLTGDIQANLNLLDHISFKIVDADALTASMSKDELEESANEIFSSEAVDMRSAPAANGETSEVEDTNPGVRILNAADENGTSVHTPTSGSRFIIVGTMSKSADISCSGMSLSSPFTLVVTVQQLGSEWAQATDLSSVALCTDEFHDAAYTNATPFINTDNGYWKCEEDGAHAFYCFACNEKIAQVSDLAGAHQSLVNDTTPNTGSASVWTHENGGLIDYYCRVCNKRIATKDNGQLIYYD